MILFTVVIAGFIVGSFLNAVIFRLKTGESFLFQRSHCMHCKHELKALDLIPVFSFIFLHGKCRYCGKKISLQYPIIELTTAVVFVLLALNFSAGGGSAFGGQFWFQIILSCFFIIIAVYDFKHYLILDKVVFPALVVAILGNIIFDLQEGKSLLMVNHHLMLGLLSGFGVAGFFLLQFVISKGRWIGLGDVKLGLLLGNVLLWPESLALLMIAYGLGAIVGIYLILVEKKQLSSKLPFGIFLSFSAIIVMLYGEKITHWYLKLIGL